MYRLIEEEWSLEEGYSGLSKSAMKVTRDDDHGIEFRLEFNPESMFPYTITCELYNGFSKDDIFNSLQEVIKWISEVSDELNVNYEDVIYERIPDDETEDDDQEYSLFTHKELNGF